MSAPIRRRLTQRIGSTRGQAMVEFALVLPLFLLITVGIIVLGIVVFYDQQLTNAAREAARFASIHSATAQCPVTSNLDPPNDVDADGRTAAWGPPPSYVTCDPPPNWAQMTAQARSKVFGVDPTAVFISACWSGYRTATQYDAPPPGDYGSGPINSSWAQCTIDGADPTTNPGAIDCAAGMATGDTASNMSEGQGRIVANRVTAYACFAWQPPVAGFLLIPQTVTFRAVISEPIQRQQ